MFYMKYFKTKYHNILLITLLITGIPAISQPPDFSKVPNLYPGDSANIVQLINTGVKISADNVVAWFPRDSLSPQRMQGIVDTLSRGIAAAEKLIKAPHEWQVKTKEIPYTFFFRRDTIISHASDAGFVSISFWRIKQGKAPWLHEALHEMLNTRAGNWVNESIPEKEWTENMPLWLAEGLPDYISLEVSTKNKLPMFDVFSRSFQVNPDSTCRSDLNGNKADSILRFIGTKGVMPELSGKDRQLYAPTFYHCSCSFVKYIAERVGIDPLLNAIAAYPNEIETLEKQAGVPMAELKKHWLNKISTR